MPKPGIKIVSETQGSGPPLRKGDRVCVRYSIQFNQGDVLAKDEEVAYTVGDRNFIAGFRYGMEGMHVGGTRCFRAGPHLCYRDLELGRIPKQAVLIFEIQRVELLPPCDGAADVNIVPHLRW